MKKKYFLKNLIISLLLIILITVYKIGFNKYKYDSLYKKYVPNYKDKYDEIKNDFDLLEEYYIFIPTEIIGISNKKINNLFLINKGLNDNVIENSFVVNDDGLVGIVKKTFNSFSIVQLISSNNVSIPVEVNGCYGTLINENNKNYIKDLINCEEIKENDVVFTSKYSISSSNIKIGKINSIKNDRIYIDYYLNPYKIRYLGVIYDNN